MTPRSWKTTVKGEWKKVRRRGLQLLFGLDARELARKLRQLGIAEGDTVLVHSSLNHFEAFTGSARDMIATLQNVIGPAGTLMMPTLSFTGIAVDFVRRGKIFDVRTSPSQTGLLTEAFRRSPGVVRSLHPTHSVAAWGATASAITAGHEHSNTPCGRGSPFARLLECNGKLLFMGASYESMTFWHTIEELIESKMPFSPFTSDEFTARVRNSAGEVLECRMRLFEPKYSRARNLGVLADRLRTKRAWRELRQPGAPLLLLKASDVLAAAEELCAAGVYCYAV